MIRTIELKYNASLERHYAEFAGLSTDTKPTGTIVTGSLFLEVDTGYIYAYDEISNTWTKIGG